MQCPSCYNDSLTPTEEGRMLCDACGEEFAGFRHEEIDFHMAGTAISNRESQSSQARSTRAKIVARNLSTAAGPALTTGASRNFVNDELLLCEAVILTARNVAERLIEMRCVPARILKPLFELLTHWVARRHAGRKGVVGRGKVFRPVEILALVSLAAVYVRSPLLPRDLCRMVVSEELPFPGFGGDGLPEHVRESTVVMGLFAPMAVPNAGEVVEAAHVLAGDEHAWSPIRRFFGDGKAEKTGSIGFAGSWNAFPVGHVQMTLVRLSRLLGLPDEFGARVLRFVELRQIASNMTWKAIDGTQPSNKEDMASFEGLGSQFAEIQNSMPKSARRATDLHGFPTDVSVQIDFINTMRLCYGTSTSKRDRHDSVNKEIDAEWEHCKGAMENWLTYGNPEDLDNVQWTSKTPAELSNTKGEEIRRYADMVDDMLTGMGENMPELWGKYTAAFAEIAESGEPDPEDSGDYQEGLRTCVYDSKSIDSRTFPKPLEGKEEMDSECAYDSVTGIVQERPPLRELKDMLWRADGVRRSERMRRKKRDDLRKVSAKEPLGNSAQPVTTDQSGVDLKDAKSEEKKSSKQETFQYARILDSDFLQEPAGIGLAWTIMRHFFAGSNVVVGGLDITGMPTSVQDRLLQACDSSLKIVILYVLWLKGKGPRPDVGGNVIL